MAFPTIADNDTVEQAIAKVNDVIGNVGEGASETPAPSTIPKSGLDGKIDEDWIPDELNGVKQFPDGIEADVTGNLTGNVSGDVDGDLTGNAGTATALATARTITVNGDAAGSANFDGSANITITLEVTQADQLETARNIALTGDVTGNVNFDGSGNVSIATTAIAAIVKDNENNTFTGTQTFNDVTISGDLVVNGTTTTLNTADLNIEDNEIVLNKNEVGAGVTAGFSGLRIERGSSTDARLFFDESIDEFKVDLGTGTSYPIQTEHENFVLIRELADLPTPVANVITLAANTRYLFTKAINLGANRFSCAGPVSIVGAEGTTCVLTTTSGSALFTTTYSIKIENIMLVANVYFDAISGGATRIFLLKEVIFGAGAAGTLGTLKSYGFILVNTCLFNTGTTGLTLGGSGDTIGTISFTEIQATVSSGTFITIPSGTIITKRIRFLIAIIDVATGCTGLNVSAGITIDAENYLIIYSQFTGVGTYTAGLTQSSAASSWSNNRVLPNSYKAGAYYMNSNATASDVTVAGTFIKVAGTTTPDSAHTQRFTLATTNRAVYTGVDTATFFVSASIVASCPANSQTVRFAIFKNGSIVTASTVTLRLATSGVQDSVALFGLVDLSTNDYIEIWVTNDTGTDNDPTISDLNLVIRELK